MNDALYKTISKPIRGYPITKDYCVFIDIKDKEKYYMIEKDWVTTRQHHSQGCIKVYRKKDDIWKCNGCF
jgi:hypothetical protein